MAQDDDKPARLRRPPPGATEPPEHVKKPQIYEIFHGSQPEDRLNTSQGATSTTPGTGAEAPKEPQKRPTVTEAVKTIKAGDFFTVYQTPCARQGFMTGIGAGALMGAARLFMGARIPTAANWAFGTFVAGSIGQYEYCQYQRNQEKKAMARVVEVMDRRAAEKREKALEAARSRADQAENIRSEVAAKKSWYSFWSR